ncbi:MAG TPA: methyl-accepting chemotaxis protein [Spirochaetota bacterium]|nr:methyl-accepting chemotaxis protein [Spirochaetota bacterium]HPQ49299.1 methyl-accepting chemotaxis protein [Spirochaetota bacterium]
MIEETKERLGASFHCFRDEIKKGYSFRVTYSYHTKDYSLNGTPYDKLMFPDRLKGGLEINSDNRSAIYLALKERRIVSSVLPRKVFGAPLLSYSSPIFDDNGILIGAVSFSNDITQILDMAKSLGNILDSDSDTLLKRIAGSLKNELEDAKIISQNLKEESFITEKSSKAIIDITKDIISVSNKLNILAFNTAIEATKVGGRNSGINIIAKEMRAIADITKDYSKQIYSNSSLLFQSSKKVYENSNNLLEKAGKLENDSKVLFDTSAKITTQKDELANLVRISIDDIAKSQDDLNAIFTLIKNEKNGF